MKVKFWITDNKENKLTPSETREMEYKNTDAIDIQGHPGDIEAKLLNIHDDIEYQTFGGIGGAITDTSATVWMQMNEEKKQEFIKAYYDKESGIGYNFGRLSIASCDFSTEDYTYVNEGDETLNSFDIAYHKEAPRFSGIFHSCHEYEESDGIAICDTVLSFYFGQQEISSASLIFIQTLLTS